MAPAAVTNLMVPIASHLQLRDLFARISSDYRIARPNEKPITCARIFVHENFEIADLSALIGACFTDFMPVNVFAIPALAPKKTQLPTKLSSSSLSDAKLSLDEQK